MSWKKVKLGDVLKNRDGRYKPNDPTIAGLKRIDKINFSGQIFLSDKGSNTDMILIKKGDLVISGINVEKGALAVYEGEEDILATIHYSAYIIDSVKIDIDFLKVFLRSPDFIQLLKEQVPGGIKTEIKPKHILPLEVYFPETTKEQKAIAELFFEKEAKLNQLNEQLSHQLTLITQLEQAILQEAVQGKLVPQDPNDEPASELLKRIKAEKEVLIKAKKLKSGKSTDQSVSYIDEYQIPKSWIWCKIDDIFFVTKLAGFEYTEHIKLKEVGEIPVVRAQNVRPLEIDKTNLLYIDRDISRLLDRCSLTKKCLLVTFIGAGIGDVATFKERERWHLAPNVAKVEPFEGCEEMINVIYVNYFLMSEIGQRELFKHIKATAQPSLSMGTIRDIDIPLPPLSEQKRIVAEIEKQFAKTKQLKEHIIANQQATEQLLKALLHQAFLPAEAAAQAGEVGEMEDANS